MRLRLILTYLFTAAQILLLASMGGCFGRSGRDKSSEPQANSTRPNREPSPIELKEKAKKTAEAKAVQADVEGAIHGLVDLDANKLEEKLDKFFNEKRADLNEKYRGSKATKEYTELLRAGLAISRWHNGIADLKEKIRHGEMMLRRATPEGRIDPEEYRADLEASKLEKIEIETRLMQEYQRLFPEGNRNRLLEGGGQLRFEPAANGNESTFIFEKDGKSEENYYISDFSKRLPETDKAQLAAAMKLERELQQKEQSVSGIGKLIASIQTDAAVFSEDAHKANLKRLKEFDAAIAAYSAWWTKE